MIRRPWLVALVGAVAVVGSATAAVRVKGVMRDWKSDLNIADDMASGRAKFDPAEMKRILDGYSATASDIAGNLKAGDYRARFEKFAGVAAKASGGALTKEGVKGALADLRGQCRSCHDSLN